MENAGGAMGSRTQGNHVGRRDGGGTMDGTMLSEGSIRQSNFFVLQTCVFFLLSKLPPDPDFCYSFGFSKLVDTGTATATTTPRPRPPPGLPPHPRP
jgi:hypothetical protein